MKITNAVDPSQELLSEYAFDYSKAKKNRFVGETKEYSMKNQEAMVVLEEIATSLRESAESIYPKSPFEEGRLLGYYEALSTILNQCSVLGIEKNEIGLTDFNPESVLKYR